jgi:uncharacterized protein YndB with AHSA1/START domain
MEGDIVQAERVIAAPPAAIFGLLADAARHPEIDGSGTLVRPTSGSSEPLALGATFGMAMKMGIGYSMENTVVEFEPDRRIAWQARPRGIFGRFSGGRIWRYELEPVDGGTKVIESWDIGQDHQRSFLRLGGLPRRTGESMDKTLQRIEEITTR